MNAADLLVIEIPGNRPKIADPSSLGHFLFGLVCVAGPETVTVRRATDADLGHQLIGCGECQNQVTHSHRGDPDVTP